MPPCLYQHPSEPFPLGLSRSTKLENPCSFRPLLLPLLRARRARPPSEDYASHFSCPPSLEICRSPRHDPGDLAHRYPPRLPQAQKRSRRPSLSRRGPRSPRSRARQSPRAGFSWASLAAKSPPSPGKSRCRRASSRCSRSRRQPWPPLSPSSLPTSPISTGSTRLSRQPRRRRRGSRESRGNRALARRGQGRRASHPSELRPSLGKSSHHRPRHEHLLSPPPPSPPAHLARPPERAQAAPSIPVRRRRRYHPARSRRRRPPPPWRPRNGLETGRATKRSARRPTRTKRGRARLTTPDGDTDDKSAEGGDERARNAREAHPPSPSRPVRGEGSARDDTRTTRDRSEAASRRIPSAHMYRPPAAAGTQQSVSSGLDEDPLAREVARKHSFVMRGGGAYSERFRRDEHRKSPATNPHIYLSLGAYDCRPNSRHHSPSPLARITREDEAKTPYGK